MGNAKTRERLRIARVRGLGFLVGEKWSARSELPKPRLHPWDTSVFVPKSRVRGVLFARRNKVPIEYQEDTEES